MNFSSNQIALESAALENIKAIAYTNPIVSASYSLIFRL